MLRNKCLDSDYIKVNDFFKDYPYPCWDLMKNTVPINPYISKSKLVCDHRFSITKQLWKTIIITYLEVIKEYLLTGNPFTLPGKMGKLELQKYKGGGIDWVKTKKYGRHIRYKNPLTEGYRPILFWDRKKAQLYNRWLWSMKLMPMFSKLIHNTVKKEPTMFSYLNERISKPTNKVKK